MSYKGTQGKKQPNEAEICETFLLLVVLENYHKSEGKFDE